MDSIGHGKLPLMAMDAVAAIPNIMGLRQGSHRKHRESAREYTKVANTCLVLRAVFSLVPHTVARMRLEFAAKALKA
jgi:hypothetical protein